MIPLLHSKRIIIKLGTGLLKTDKGLINHNCINTIAKEVSNLKNKGIEIVIVSSGAIGLGMSQLKIPQRPSNLSQLQACAAIGQSKLINLWQQSFNNYGLIVAQILLTQDDLASNDRYEGVTNTLSELLSKNAVPIINENDLVSTEEIRFGDNDTLSAYVAKAMNADLLMILSNISGLMNPKNNYDVIHNVEKIDSSIEALASDTKSETSVGGMISKIEAAKIATQHKCGVFIGDGNDQEIFQKLLKGFKIGTYFTPSK